MKRSIFPMLWKRKVQSHMFGSAVCPKWCGGFLLADGSKSPFYQHPGVHGDAWFDKDGMYSIDCQVLSV